MTYWDKRRVLVTGAGGFFGSWLVEALKQRGADVFSAYHNNYDLLDRDDVHALISHSRPDTVFHLAAKVGGIGANRDNPAGMLYDNAMMGLHVINECHLASVRKTVIAGSICAYPKFCPVPFKEDDLWNGYPEETNAPYGIAKKLLLVQAQAYRQQFGMNAIMLFPVNMYGPRDNFDPKSSHVIPAMIRKCVEAVDAGHKNVTLWGDGTPTREFLYVADAAEGVILAAEHYDGADPVNLGTGFEIAMYELADKVARATGYTGEFTWNTTQPNGQPRRQLDVRRARERFGFVAKTSFQAGLAKTVEWFNANRDIAGRWK